jgi:hypothetical protein
MEDSGEDPFFEFSERLRSERLTNIQTDLEKTLPADFPEELVGWSVDECLECLTLGKAREVVERELLEAAPNAYETRKPLSSLWTDLNESTRVVLAKASKDL